MSESLSNNSRKKRRPLGLWLLAMLYAVAGIMGIVRAVLAWHNGDFYLSLGMQVNPVVLIAYGIFWALAGLSGMTALLIRRPWAKWVVWGGALTLIVSYWLDRLILTVNPNRQVNWGFALLMNGLFVVWTAWILHRRRASYYFSSVKTEKDDHHAG